MPIGTKRSVLNTPSKSVPLAFARAGVAYDPYGNTVIANQPRFNNIAGKSGILIEESTTNLFTSVISQNLTSNYTTGTLNGTYTFSCGTGSYVLSGGATDTVTPSTPQTKTISNATVTVTGTSTLNQLEFKAYPTSWVLGGTTRNAETLTIPSSVLNIDTNGTVNLLSAGVSNNLVSGTPYTTSIFVAGVAYTFSCGTGSYVLSGGASGTVTPSNPITVTPGAVTVTMTGTSTYNQLEPRNKVTPWILGGTQRNTGAGTIEMGMYFSSVNATSRNQALFSAWAIYRLDISISTVNMLQSIMTNIGGVAQSTGGYNITSITGWHKIAISWDIAKYTLYFDGIPVGTRLNNPQLLIGIDTPYIGGHVSTQQVDTLIRNVCISKIKRTDIDIQNRANQQTFPVDNQVSAFALLESDLRGVAKV
jgi:hypothetical protein